MPSRQPFPPLPPPAAADLRARVVAALDQPEAAAGDDLTLVEQAPVPAPPGFRAWRIAGTTVTPGAGSRSSSIRILRDPHRGCCLRISATATSTSVGAWCGHHVGRCDRSTSPIS